MTIKQNGGIFGRNPEFNDVSAKDVSVTDEITILENGVDVGGVRSLSGQAQLSGTTTGITFGAQSVLPTNGGSAIQNGTRDIGGASNFWRNVYVSTGVYFGSQTTATHLDDYEEGTWTPIFTTSGTDFTSITYDSPATGGKYTKVGNLVHIQMTLKTDSVTVGSASGDLRIGGLPYTATSDTNGQDGQSALAVTSVQNFATNQPDSAIVISGSDNIRLFSRSSSNGATSTMGFAELDTGANDNIIRLAGTYIAS